MEKKAQRKKKPYEPTWHKIIKLVVEGNYPSPISRAASSGIHDSDFYDYIESEIENLNYTVLWN